MLEFGARLVCANFLILVSVWIVSILDGIIPTYDPETATEEEIKRMHHYELPSMKLLEKFKLTSQKGHFSGSELSLLLGENGTGNWYNYLRLYACW